MCRFKRGQRVQCICGYMCGQYMCFCMLPIYWAWWNLRTWLICALVVHDVVQNALDWAIQTLPLPSHLFAYGKFLLAWLSCTLLWYFDIECSRFQMEPSCHIEMGVECHKYGGSVCCVWWVHGRLRGGWSQFCKAICNFIALDVVMSSNFLNMVFVRGVGDELYTFFFSFIRTKYGWFLLGCGATNVVAYTNVGGRAYTTSTKTSTILTLCTRRIKTNGSVNWQPI